MILESQVDFNYQKSNHVGIMYKEVEAKRIVQSIPLHTCNCERRVYFWGNPTVVINFGSVKYWPVQWEYKWNHDLILHGLIAFSPV